MNRTMGKTRNLGLTILLSLLTLVLLFLPSNSMALREPDPGMKPAPDFDIRSLYDNAVPDRDVNWAKTPEQEAAINALGQGRRGFSVRWSALTRAPSRIYDIEAPITGPRGGPKKDVTTGFLLGNLSLFGLQPDDVAETRTSREFVTQHNGVNHITIQQQINGIDVFEATFMANVDRDGRILNLSSSFMPRIRQSVNTSTPQITHDDAVSKAAQSAGVTLIQDSEVKGLLYFPLAIGKIRLAYEVIIEDGKTPNIYRSLVDAVDGTVLWRKNLVYYASPYAHGMVFTGDSPNPNTPIGSSTGQVQRTDTDFDGLGFFPLADPHADWWNGSGEANRTRTISNNAQVRDPSNNYAVASADPITYFNFPLSFPYDITADPATYTDASIVNTFYRLNRLHDQLYDWGFDEVAGNYQNNNFGLGGTAGDRIDCHVQVPGEGCNAHSGGGGINTGMCGNNCWTATTPPTWNCRDIGFETPIVAHEFGHSIHFRLIPSLAGAQEASEGYADIFAITTFAEAGDDLFGSYPFGQWSWNNVNGIRRRPYSTDQTVFPYTYGDIKDCQPVTNTTIYWIGEIWCNTVWMARANLVWKYGFQTGHPTMMKLIVDGMKLAPSQPDFLDLRDAILLSDRTNNAGVNQCILWDAFAKMGLGWSAKSAGFNDGAPLEAFDTPSTCTPNIRLNGSLDFGAVCPSKAMTKGLEIFNTGTGDLIVKKVSRVAGSTDITVDPNPTLPVFISQDAHVDFTVRCAPSSAGIKTATIRIESNDADQPTIDLTATCEGETQKIVTSIANSGNFGDVCLGTFKDLDLTISNSGGCSLHVSNISSPSAQFVPASVISYPIVIAAGTSTNVPIRFQPTNLGPKSANINVTSDGGNPVVAVSGTVPSGDIRVPSSTDFGAVCAGTLAEKTISVENVGKCNLNVSSAGFDPACADFALVNNLFPATVSPDSHVDLVIRFTPTSAGPKTCTLKITSDDPDTPVVTRTVTGNTPFPSIDVPPDLAFQPEVIQSIGACSSKQPFPISNNKEGRCNLTITNIAIGGENAGDYSLSGLPSFPIILEPGHVAGENNLKAVFAPIALDRDRLATLTVTYVSDPVTGATLDVTRSFCGEGVNTGARVLVRAGGVPLATVEKIQLLRINANRNRRILDTVDIAKDVPLTTVTPTLPCTPFQYHREYGTVSNPIQLLPGSYQVTVSAIVNGKRKTQTVGFNVGTCDFNPAIVINF